MKKSEVPKPDFTIETWISEFQCWRGYAQRSTLKKAQKFIAESNLVRHVGERNVRIIKASYELAEIG